MKKWLIVSIIALAFLLVLGFFVLTNNKSSDKDNDPNQMVDCGEMDNPGCFVSRMNVCLPVTGRFTSDGNNVEMIILGQENETCHFQRRINNVLNLDCYFPKGTMNSDILAQTLGDDKGLQSVVDEACKL